MSRPKESLRFYEAERHNVTLSHSDFSHEENFDYLEETERVNEFLLSKNWDKYFTRQKSGAVICDTTIANKVFTQCYNQFKNDMDTVQLFHLITDFYDIHATFFFNKLVQAHRKKLVNDLEIRIGKMKSTKIKKIGQDRIQLAFNLIFNNPANQ